jgi:hypothetical protein
MIGSMSPMTLNCYNEWVFRLAIIAHTILTKYFCSSKNTQSGVFTALRVTHSTDSTGHFHKFHLLYFFNIGLLCIPVSGADCGRGRDHKTQCRSH